MTKVSAQLADLDKAVSRLAEALALAETAINRDATIQRFEFTFELAWKAVQSIVEMKGLSASTSPRDAIRVAAQQGFIDNPELWIEFLKKRNLSAHTYSEEQAKDVYEWVKKFLPEVKNLLARLKTEEDSSSAIS